MPDKIDIKAVQEGITPFWHKLPFFFLFPFRTGPLIFLVCITVASVLAGLVMGGFGLAFKGLLVYLGLRYGFNVLDLFAKGRFEGESPDYSLWGPERRPAKLGLVIVLFIVIGSVLGNAAVDSRIARDPAAQAQLIEAYTQAHAVEVAQRQREREAFDKRHGLETVRPDAARAPAEDDKDAPDANAEPPSDAPLATAPPPGPSREEMIDAQRPGPGDALWWSLLPAWYWLVMVGLSLMLPAAAIMVALEDAFFKALNPLNVLWLLRTMGAAYFVLWAFFLAIAGTRHWVLSVGHDWPTALQLPVELGLGTYLALVLCALMGYTLYQFHQALHLDVEVDFDTHRKAGGAAGIARAGSVHAALRKTEPQDPKERKIQALVEAGNLAEAIAELRDQMRYDRLDPALNTRLHQLYVLQGDTATTLTHGQQWLSGLARAQQGKEILAALRALQAIDPQFKPQDGAVVLPAAAAAMKRGEHELAVQLVQGFDKRFPQHADTPAVFFIGARLMSEYQRRHDKAAALLRGLLARFPEHALAPEIQTYLTVLERMQTKP